MKIIADILSLMFRLAFRLCGYALLIIWKIYCGVMWLLAKIAGFNTDAPFLKTRIVALCLIAGYVQAPLYAYYAVKYPVRAVENYGRLAVGIHNAKQDASRLISRAIPNVIERPVKTAYRRYGLDGLTNGMQEATGLKDVPWYHKLLSPWRWV